MRCNGLKMLLISAIVSAPVLVGGAIAASAATIAGVTASGHADVLQTASSVTEVRQPRQRHYRNRWGGYRGKHYRSGHRYRHGYYGRRRGHRGRGYVTPYRGYPGFYYGPSIYSDPYYYEGEPAYYDVAPPSGDRCAYWHRQCVKNWGARNPDYFGCMRYEKCGR